MTRALPLSGLKKSPIVYAFAIVFMLAPFGNIALSMLEAGLRDWYFPWAWLRTFFLYVPLSNQIFLVLTFVAGACLLRRRRSSWVLALAALLLTTGFNIYNGFFWKSPLPSRFPLALGAIFSSSAVLVLLYYFRYPYLERREDLLGVHARNSTRVPVTLESLGQAAGSMEDVSVSGARIVCNPDVLSRIREKTALTLRFEGLPTPVASHVIRVGVSDFGVKFDSLDAAQRSWIHNLIDKS